jgi:hypothetical protein
MVHWSADNYPTISQHGLFQYPVDIVLGASSNFHAGVAGVTGQYLQVIDPDNFCFYPQLLCRHQGGLQEAFAVAIFPAAGKTNDLFYFRNLLTQNLNYFWQAGLFCDRFRFDYCSV